MHVLKRLIVPLALAASAALAPNAFAQDKVKMGLFIASSAMPYFIARERGYFAAENLEVEGVPLATHPLIVQALVKGDLDTASNLLSLEGANINVLRPGTANYFSINCQNTQYQLEAFVVSSKNTTIKTLKDLKGQRIMAAPGPGNLFVAKGVLKAIGLEEGRDYTMQEQPMAAAPAGPAVGAVRGRLLARAGGEHDGPSRHRPEARGGRDRHLHARTRRTPARCSPAAS